MSDTRAKSLNALMKHLRTDKKIKISGSKGKNDLRNIGYYHGYKGYRFYREAKQQIPFTDFSQLKAVYDFDMKLKAWFYPHIMFIETALKNRVLEYTLEDVGSGDFVKIFNQALNAHNSEKHSSGAYKNKLHDKLTLRQEIYDDIARNVNTSSIVQHFYYNNQPVPIWAIFELITLGEFGKFYISLNEEIKIKICESLGIDKSYNSSGEMLKTIIFAIKDLRNSIAHNKPIFDVRFKTGKLPLSFFDYLTKELQLPKPNPYYGHTTEIKFEQIIDYFLLIIFLLKKLGTSKYELKQYIKNFESLFISFKTKIPTEIYKMIVPISIDNKLLFLKDWV
jgi:abortive infection bacteriophage resistance protein